MKSTLKLIIACFFVLSFLSTTAIANVQPNFQTISFLQVDLGGVWGDQKERTVTIGADNGFVQVVILKEGQFVGGFEFNAPGNYAYEAPASWEGAYDFVILNEGQETVFVAEF